MFTVWMLLALFVGGCSVVIFYNMYQSGGSQTMFTAGVVAAVLAILLVFLAFNTPSGKLKWAKLTATTGTNHWLVIDRSGGETMCHWLLEDGYVTASSQSDGWEFYEADGNQVYLSGDAIVVRVLGDLDAFKATYRARYNIPVEQKALK